MKLAWLATVAATVSACGGAKAPPVATPAAAATAPASTAPAPPVGRPPTLRLPGDVRPTREALELTIDPTAATFTGVARIEVTVLQPLTTLWLNATDLKITAATVGGVTAKVVPGGEDFIGLALPSALTAGPTHVELTYQGGIDHERSRGLYAEREGDAATGEVYAYTFFEPIDARRAFPCFDEPSAKIPWQLTFHVRAGDVALGNAAVHREHVDGGGMKTVELAESRPLPSYLVAFVVGPFEVVDGGTAGRLKTPIRFLIPKGRAGELGYAKEVTPRAVAALEDYLDIPYPFGKLDVAVVPRFWGTMEHPGIVAMGQPLTLIRPEQATRERKQAYANILIHELSHYWFGDLVTMAWWDDTWLNEALGEWNDLHITDAVEPSWRYADRRVRFATGAMEADELLATQRIRLPVTTKEAIAASFDGAITYAKGASVLRMFEAFVGKPTWRAFLHGYLSDHAWGNASADQFLADAQAKLGAPIADGLRSFLEQPGVPRITGALRCTTAGAELALHQQRALTAGVSEPTARVWHLPVCARYGDGKAAGRACTLLTGADGALPLPPLSKAAAGCPTWVVLNADAAGYYRSSLTAGTGPGTTAAADPALTRALLTPGSPLAKAAAPTAAERLMLGADVFAAIERGELPLDARLALAPALIADPDDVVAQLALGAAALPDDALDDELYAAHQRFVRAVLGPRATQLGWRRAAGDDDQRHELRGHLVPMVARAGDPALIKEGTRLAEAWLAAPTTAGLADDLVGDALAVAAADGDAARFGRYLAAARAAVDRTNADRLIAALGGFHDQALAARARDLILDGGFDLRESLRIIWGQLLERRTRAAAWTWFEGHLDALLAKMRSDEASWMLGGAASIGCTPPRRAAAEALLVARAAKIDGAQALVARGLQSATRCITTYARELPGVRRFFATRRGR